MRAFTRAQLIEEGFEVTTLADWKALVAFLDEEVIAPNLVIAELSGDEPPAVLSLLRSLPVPRLILRRAGAPDAEALRAAGIEAVLSRPYTVGDVVHAARALLARSSDPH
jgi:predicted Fe-Mo cluster-binding NifX family protein